MSVLEDRSALEAIPNMILVVILQDETFSILVLELSHFESVPKRGIELHEVCFSLMSAHIKAVTGDTIL